MPTAQPAPPRIELHTDAQPPTSATLVALGFNIHEDAFVLARPDQDYLAEVGCDGLALLERSKPGSSAGELVRHELFGRQPARLLLVGLGKQTTVDYRRAGASLVRGCRSEQEVSTSIGAFTDSEQIAAFVEGLVLGGFGYHQKTGPDQGQAALTVHLTGVPVDCEPVVAAATVRALASWRSRAYALTPSNQKNPARIAEWAGAAAAEGGLAMEVWDDARLGADGFGGILAVGSGSEYGSRLIRLDYLPDGVRRAGRRTARTDRWDRRPASGRIVLVGKGITFDSGGLSIKPADAMKNMKRDMTGAGVVIAVMAALRRLGVTQPVTGLMASAENAVGAAAMRPGDVITHYGGRTTEVGNTDAEGRLVLADALAYANQNLAPVVLIDIATLTGAAKVGLGTSTAALFANDDDLAAELQAAGEAAGEPVWRLPLSEEYEPRLKSPIADATNAPGGPGAVTAALFLQHFVAPARWAHLDIASVGDAPNDAFEYTAGATGFGARLLLRWLAAR